MNDRVVGGRFRLEESVGAGGMGVVFRARDEVTGQAVALKELVARDERELARARREIAVLSRLEHPGIVAHVADGVTDDETLWVAMEWIDGITVAERLLGDGLSLAEAVVIARQVAVALAAAHRADILHRDLKPSNVLLVGGDPAKAKLIDFGVARVNDSMVDLTRTGAAIGTPGYMSPEQARGTRDLTPASDVFGLGCLLYECATARPAFSGSVAAAVLAKILLVEPFPLRKWCSEAPPWLQTLVERMLRKDVGERIATCDEVAAALADPVPEGPRRTARGQAAAMLRGQVARPVHPVLHFTVLAGRGHPQDTHEPPDDTQRSGLETVAGQHGARLEVCANGSVIAYLTGGEDTAERAACCALAMQKILAGWSIAISAPRADQTDAIDRGTQLFGAATVAAIVLKHEYAGAIVVDRETVPKLERGFVIERPSQGNARLIARRDPAPER